MSRYQKAFTALERLDPGKVRDGVAVGLRDGAILALVAAGLSSMEIARLEAGAVSMLHGHVVLKRELEGLVWSAILPDHLGARVLAWLVERRSLVDRRSWPAEALLFQGARGPIRSGGIRKVLNHYVRGRRR